MPQILVARATDADALALFDARDDVTYEVIETPSVEDLEARIAELDAVLLGLTPVQAPLIAKAKRLKVVSRFGVGYDNVDVGALTAQGIALTTVGDANAVTVAEHALMLMLAATRELVRIGAERGRAARPGLKLGICGEHGGDPASIRFCQEVGLDYVSCSPYRVPIARLAAAQAALAAKG